MTLPVLLGLAGLILMGIGFSRGMVLAVIIGAVLLTDAMAAYVVLGPATQFVHGLLHPGR